MVAFALGILVKLQVVVEVHLALHLAQQPAESDSLHEQVAHAPEGQRHHIHLQRAYHGEAGQYIMRDSA